MSVQGSARDHLLALQQRFVEAQAGDPGWLARLREEARAAFADQGLPHTRLEEWRYTNVTALAKLPYVLAAPPVRAVTRPDLEHHAFPVFACSVYVFVNGRFAPQLSSATRLECGTRIESLAALRRSAGADALAPYLGRLVDQKRHPFAALATACLDDGAVVRVPRGAGAAQPLHLVFVSAPGEQPALVHPRLLIVAEPGSRLALIEDHVNVGVAPGLTNAVSEIHVGADASVDYVLLQREAEHRFHVSQLAASQERGSRLSAHSISLGSAFVRNDAGVVLAGEGAECRLDGLYVAGGSRLVDNHTLVDHAVPRCTSRERYKGILGGKARGVFRGRILVRPDAQKTSAQQSNANLLLDTGAEVDSKPQLEIHADDVRCNHGSSVGQLDAEALFYLRSRGLGAEVARDLLMRAFASEVLRELPIPALADALDDVLQQQLAHVGVSA